ncbi:glycosyltransferase family 4 protein [Stratiformator vulcanicus]|uniref:Glycosyl transferases group 1 n=1 Tax=Stratiformator vulcanicus TaxID=2527980 RepID=A0A517QWX7_9PLAN|nr:glycosyltransferase family 4 protein [Stratiformator vulcanicus]QDT36097.1 Glycosyl transferases group 1 [Stratiformator vulcanicus]
MKDIAHSPRTLHLLQVCNVGDILGGTAACAWTVTQSLPDFQHSVAFVGPVTSTTRDAFQPHDVIAAVESVDAAVEQQSPDLVLLHNTPRDRMPGPNGIPTLQYLHSHIDAAPADATLFCSRWLAERFHKRVEEEATSRPADSAVVYQAVPRPPRLQIDDERPLRDRLVIGRICTPKPHKWPRELIEVYRQLNRGPADVSWEFVGCPEEQKGALADACFGRAIFHPASRQARSLLWRWDAMLYHHPTLTESFGRTCAEAMRCGCIPIVDNRGGFREQIVPQTGFLCDDVAAFSAAILALRDRSVRTTRSRRCRAHADEHFSLSRFRSDLLGRLQIAVRSHQAAARVSTCSMQGSRPSRIA